MSRKIILTIFTITTLSVSAQTSDSLIVQTLRKNNICFSHDNSVTLLLSGQQKFDDMSE